MVLLGGGLLALGLGAALLAADGTRPSRAWNAGLVPEDVPRTAAPVAPLNELASVSLRAEIAAEEARLAALRQSRIELEREMIALRQEAERRQREMSGRKPATDAAATGSTVAPQPVAGPTAVPPPAERPLRVFVHHRANSGAAAAAAEEVVQNLRGSGFEPQAARPVPFVPSTPVVRYFHEEDQAAAARLAARLGHGWAIQDFRAFLPQPAPQTLEVWLPRG